MILISTVMFSGTHSLFTYLGLNPSGRHKEWEQFHCKDRLQYYMDLDIHTTMRDPYRIAASWCNRGKMDKKSKDNLRWRHQWEWWAKIRSVATVYSVETLKSRENIYPDKLGLHKALDEGDMKHYYKYVPKGLLDLALNIVENK